MVVEFSVNIEVTNVNKTTWNSVTAAEADVTNLCTRYCSGAYGGLYIMGNYTVVWRHIAKHLVLDTPQTIIVPQKGAVVADAGQRCMRATWCENADVWGAVLRAQSVEVVGLKYALAESRRQVDSKASL